MYGIIGVYKLKIMAQAMLQTSARASPNQRMEVRRMDTPIVSLNYIYTLIDPLTNQIRYVGKSIDVDRRLKGHLSEARRGKKDHKNRWIASLLKKNCVPIIKVIDICGHDWKERETYWISKFNADGCSLTNSKLGGDGLEPCDESRRKMSEAKKGKPPSNKGKKTSEEGKQKQREAARRRFDRMTEEERKIYATRLRKNRPNIKGKHKLTPEHKEKLRLANLGNKHMLGYKPTAEAIEKTASAHRGKPRSDETKRKIRESNKGKKRSDEFRAKMSELRKGKTLSVETRQRMSESIRKAWRDKRERSEK